MPRAGEGRPREFLCAAPLRSRSAAADQLQRIKLANQPQRIKLANQPGRLSRG